jgi:photosystem II stability/assembly factor-like uncharacterized protein
MFRRSCRTPTKALERGASRASDPSAPGATCPARVQAAALSSITFFDASYGLGLWSQGSRCGARLALTADAGKTWQVTGARLPGPASDFSVTVNTAFLSPRLGWVAGGGILDVTRDGGAHWAEVHLGGKILRISAFGDSLWAFVAPCAADPGRCRYRLDAITVTGNTWQEVGRLPAALGNYGPLVVARLSARRALVAMGQVSRTPAYLTTDGGRTWAPVDACLPHLYSPIALAATGTRDAWVLCLGGAGAGRSAKSVLRSTDGGRKWQLIAEDRSLVTGAPQPVPTDDGDVLAVPSQDVLWFAGVNLMWGSLDGGRRWSRVAGTSFGGAGEFATFSFSSPADGWLLAPGLGLWRTTDGRHWRRL